jgi:glycosyltransferase involved in cell wall biosynthesis
VINEESVGVLLATKNGIAFLDEQLQSVFSQRDYRCKVYFLDDNSTDETKLLINLWRKKGFEIEEVSADVSGLPDVFFHLLDQAGEHEFYAFSDQDDVWVPAHLKMSIDNLRRGYEVSSGQRQFIDFTGKVIPIGKVNSNSTPCFSNSLVENLAYGNTLVFSSKFRKLLLALDSKGAAMHDSWIYMISTFLNCIYIDNRIHIHYRLHGHNATGIRNRNIFKVFDQQKKFKIQAVSFFFQCKRLDSTNANLALLQMHVKAMTTKNPLRRLAYFKYIIRFRKPNYFGFVLGLAVIMGLI